MINIQQVKSANKKDLVEMNRLLRQLSSSARKLDMKAYRRLLGNKNLILIGARDNGRLIGMGVLMLMETPVAFHTRMEDVVVDSAYRGQGIGTKIIRFILTLAKKKGGVSADFTSSARRGGAHQLYEHLGFKQRDTNVYRVEL